MATEQWIESASRDRKPAVGDNFMVRDAVLVMPQTAREAELEELRNARRCVLRYAFADADQVLDILGLDPLTDAERAAGPLPKPEPEAKPRPARTPQATPTRPPTRRRRQPYKQCVGCHEVKPADQFKGRSYRCRDCS